MFDSNILALFTNIYLDTGNSCLIYTMSLYLASRIFLLSWGNIHSELLTIHILNLNFEQIPLPVLFCKMFCIF